jgi:hypothetical protein
MVIGKYPLRKDQGKQKAQRCNHRTRKKNTDFHIPSLILIFIRF